MLLIEIWTYINRARTSAWSRLPDNLNLLGKGKVDAMQGYSVDEAVDPTLRGHAGQLDPDEVKNGYVAYAEVSIDDAEAHG